MATLSGSRAGYSFSDWSTDDGYRSLIGADPSAFAWEWLRRAPGYREAYRNAALVDRLDDGSCRPFGLERCEDPARSVPLARPIWMRDVAQDALTANVADIGAPRTERLDLRLLAPLVTIAIDGDDVEHLLLSDGRHFLRIDIMRGTLIGCPAALTYLLRGLTGLQGPISALGRLSKLVTSGSFDQTAFHVARDRKWVLELRTADALALGCDQQTIARGLFGALVPDHRWRSEGASYRRRVQRLVHKARRRLSAPIEGWFAR